jgi:hypothetical protein
MRIVQKNTLLSNETLSASGYTQAVQKSWADEAIAHIKARGKVGSTSFAFKIQSSPDNIVWDDLDDSATLTDAGQDVVRETNFGRWIRVAYTRSSGSLTGVDIILQCKGE